MIEENGTYIKLYRKFLNWGWFTDIPTCHLFIYLLIRAQYNEKEFKGVKVSSGELTTSLQIMSDESGLTKKQVRTALDKLEKTGEVARLRAQKYTHIKIIKWADYQGLTAEEGTKEGTERALKGHLEGTERAPIKERKEYKESNKEKNINNKSDDLLPYDEIIDYLNLKTNRKYRTSTKAKQYIKARWNEKFTLEEFKQVIDNMSNKWLNDPDMNRYLRPETLFSTKMNGYLNEQIIEKPKEKKGIDFFYE